MEAKVVMPKYIQELSQTQLETLKELIAHPGFEILCNWMEAEREAMKVKSIARKNKGTHEDYEEMGELRGKYQMTILVSLMKQIVPQAFELRKKVDIRKQN